MSNTTSDAMAAFLARGGTVTKCAPAEANATPLRTLRRRAELAAEQGERLDSERMAERRAERFGAARLDGFSTSDALDYSNE